MRGSGIEGSLKAQQQKDVDCRFVGTRSSDKGAESPIRYEHVATKFECRVVGKVEMSHGGGGGHNESARSGVSWSGLRSPIGCGSVRPPSARLESRRYGLASLAGVDRSGIR